MLFGSPSNRSFTLRGMFVLLTLVVVFVGGYSGFTRFYRYNVSLQMLLDHPDYLQVAEPEPGRVVLSAAKDRPLTLVLYRLTARQPAASEYERVLIPLPLPSSDWLCYSTEFQVSQTINDQGQHLLINGQEHLSDSSAMRAQVRANPFPAISVCGTCMIYERQRPGAMLTRVPLTKTFDVSRHLHSKQHYWLFATRHEIAALLQERLIIND